jgi:hypothetical protein
MVVWVSWWGRTLEAMFVPGHSLRVSSSQHVRGCPVLVPVAVMGMVSRHGRGRGGEVERWEVVTC